MSLLSKINSFLTLLLALWLAAPAQAQDSELLLAYDRRSDGVASADETPLVRVYSDGRLVVHRPEWQVDAGTWTARLSTAELAMLKADLKRDVFDLDPAQLDRAVREAMSRQAKSSGTIYYRSENLTSEFLIPGTKAAGSGLRVLNLRHLARTLPSVTVLSELAAGEDRLLGLSRHPRLERAVPPAGKPREVQR